MFLEQKHRHRYTHEMGVPVRWKLSHRKFGCTRPRQLPTPPPPWHLLKRAFTGKKLATSVGQDPWNPLGWKLRSDRKLCRVNHSQLSWGKWDIYPSGHRWTGGPDKGFHCYTLTSYSTKWQRNRSQKGIGRPLTPRIMLLQNDEYLNWRQICWGTSKSSRWILRRLWFIGGKNLDHWKRVLPTPYVLPENTTHGQSNASFLWSPSSRSKTKLDIVIIIWMN